jgi:hypothetical protein
MENTPSNQTTPEEMIDANPLESYPPLSSQETYEVFEALREVIEKIRKDETSINKEKFETEKNSISTMSEDDIVDFLRNCKKGSPNFLKLEQNPELTSALYHKLVKELIPKV